MVNIQHESSVIIIFFFFYSQSGGGGSLTRAPVYGARAQALAHIAYTHIDTICNFFLFMMWQKSEYLSK